jgi:hypothetical protein
LFVRPQNPDSAYVDILKFVLALETRLALLLDVKVSLTPFSGCGLTFSLGAHQPSPALSTDALHDAVPGDQAFDEVSQDVGAFPLDISLTYTDLSQTRVAFAHGVLVRQLA